MPDDKKHPMTDLSPEQVRTLLSSDLKSGGPVAKKPRGSPARNIAWAAAILLAALLYVIFKFTSAPSKVIVVNTSGEDAASVVLLSGDQRVDLGGLGNGEVRK